MFSLVVTEGVGYEAGQELEGMTVALVDVSRAFLQAGATRKVYAPLLAEGKEAGVCGRFGGSTYGAGDAAQTWSDTYVTFLGRPDSSKEDHGHAHFTMNAWS